MAQEQTVTTSEMDVCNCGDYRHQHDGIGCRLCRNLPHPWSIECRTFKLDETATRNDKSKRQANMRDQGG